MGGDPAGETIMSEGFQGECQTCGWVGTFTEDYAAANAEAAEHANYCWHDHQESQKTDTE